MREGSTTRPVRYEDCCVPVSYTHLPSARAKAQLAVAEKYEEAGTRLAKAAAFFAQAEQLATAGQWDPVSYTHLDVYKRQVFAGAQAVDWITIKIPPGRLRSIKPTLTDRWVPCLRNHCLSLIHI